MGYISYSEAQQRRNRIEKATDHTQISTGQDQLQRDLQELSDFKSVLSQLDKAWKRANSTKVNRLKNDLLIAIDREINQSYQKLHQDTREVSQSKSELISENRDIRKDKRDIRQPGRKPGEKRELAGERRDKRDDRKDLMDDRKDYKNQQEIRDRQKEIYASLKTYNFVLDAPSISKAQKNKALLEEFVKTLEADIWFTRTELEEDKSEVREDRRESRSDRR